MVPKIIKTDAEYKEALARVSDLMSARPGTPDGDELELLSFLVEDYEQRTFHIDLPDPISAIRFRMEQGGLEDGDLTQYLGSKSKVSEVLNGKRPLSLTMIRRLHEGLGIPAEVLLQEAGARLSEKYKGINWRLYPLAEIAKRQWIPGFRGTRLELLENVEELLGPFLFPKGFDLAQPAFCRQNIRAGSRVNGHALHAWMARVVQQAADQRTAPYVEGTVTDDFIRDVGRLSQFEEGPLLARESLQKSGIHLVIERQLPGTHLDGMAMRCCDRGPVVALTLRYDRLDNFWFTLCHELAHVRLHLCSNNQDAFVDDLDQKSKDRREQDADVLASNCLIPADEWDLVKRSRWTDALIKAIASRLRVDPAVVAGRIRKEKNDYRIFSNLLGNKKVRKMFGLSN